MSPEKHKGYAIQWFSMALAVLIAWLFFSFSKDLHHD
jgi:cytochrome oxidase assembly protein ShyY1